MTYVMCYDEIWIPFSTKNFYLSGCPDEFFDATSDTCLHIANPSINAMDAYCDRLHSKLFARPLSQEMANKLANEMIKMAENWMPLWAWLGMQNEEQKNPSARKCRAFLLKVC